MTPRRSGKFHRRQFLRTISGLVAGASGAIIVRAGELPDNTNLIEGFAVPISDLRKG